MIEKRLIKLFSRLEELGCESALTVKKEDIFYFTGHFLPGILVLISGRTVLYLNRMDMEGFDEQAGKVDDARLWKGSAVFSELKKLLNGKKTAADPEGMSAAFYIKLKESLEGLKEKADLFSGIRMIKDDNEISKISRACFMAAERVESLDPESVRGKTEQEIAGRLAGLSWSGGASGPAFTPIVAAAENAANPHHFPTGKIIGKGWLEVDYGIVYNYYCSDLTRIIILDKVFNNLRPPELLEKLCEVKSRIVEDLKPGENCGRLYEKAADLLRASGLSRELIHGLGHGVGLEIHERPYLKKGSADTIMPGMTLTVEPGFYNRGSGGMRVEDTYLITEGGAKPLTRISQ